MTAAGDLISTDIRMANEAGMASALVLTGATGLEEASLGPRMEVTGKG